MFCTFSIHTERGNNLTDITPQVRGALEQSGVRDGVCYLNVPHTTAALTINSALDPATGQDIVAELKRLVPTRVDFIHQYDTPADAAGHIKSVLVGTSLSVPIREGKLALGASQFILFCEFDGPRARQVQCSIVRDETTTRRELLQIQPEVTTALDARRAVVALESTLITHGFPPPDNLKVARAIEAAVREGGAVPATIAILGGKLTVGLEHAQLDYLSTAKNVRKCSRRDLGTGVAQKLDGATTVAGTMIVAAMAGIRVLATGGIGGVHRGHPFDISADLEELARTPVTVVCAGAKSLLDLPLTLEQLETRGVPVIGYGTDELPAFYSRSSGLPVDTRADSPEEIAAIVCARRALGLSGGELVCVPLPLQAELPRAQAEAAIVEATRVADEEGITGAALTPFVLAKISELTNGRSQESNLALLLNNARLAAQIAQALIEIQ